jgi:hypothetical protein
MYAYFDTLSKELPTLSCIYLVFSGGQVTNYHVVAKLATDTSGLQRCKVFPYAVNSTKLRIFILDGSNIFYIQIYTSIRRFS